MPERQAETAAETPAAEVQVRKTDLLDQIVDEARVSRDPGQRDRSKDIVANYIEEVAKGSIRVGTDVESSINRRISEVDQAISKYLNGIMHHPDFQKLEATWRGLKYLMDQSELGTNLQIKVLNVNKADLIKEFKKQTEFDQSALFKKIYEEEYGVFGGSPFGAIVGDYDFSRSGPDIELLEKISNVAAAAHAPFISNAGPDLLNLESFTSIDSPRDLSKIFESTEFARWKAFRQTEDSRYVALALPRMLIRQPYGEKEVPVEAFGYEENVDGTDHNRYLWANASWALAARITNSFALHGWCATIRGVESGGLVQGLPVHNFRTESGDVAMKCPTESPVTDRREKELADLGFVPLVHRKNTTDAAFFSVQSAQKPKVYNTDSATANARISAQLPYIFAVSRFAHYLKVMMRDKIGGYMSRSEAQTYLSNWIADYVVANDDATLDVKAKRPLREARIEVEEIPGKPGAYRATAYLRPHFQLDELTVSMRLVAELPKAAK